MKKQLLFAAIAGVALVSAAPPGDPIPWEDEESLRGYPPCSASVTDRCIQTYERGVAKRTDLARKDDSPRDVPEAARGGPAEPADAKYAATDYPPCSSTVTDRCVQTKGRGAQPAAQRMARTAPKAKREAAPMRLAMRAGERG
jgi:hypothetical protein